jgi:hypothetical protein
VHHERVDQALDDGGLGLLEGLLLVATSGVRGVDGIAEGNVVGQGDVLDLDLLGAVVRRMQRMRK